jgi:DNA-binding CsgD family transcriptional regulator
LKPSAYEPYAPTPLKTYDHESSLVLPAAIAHENVQSPVFERSVKAVEAAAAFEAIGWPWLAALGYELGGETKRALELYRTLGALRDLRRMEVNRTPDTAVLSLREREVAELVAKGHTNDEVAQILHISARTVEKHVSSALLKLNLRSRVQLGRLLN